MTNVDAERESDKISALVIGCALRQGARIRVCSSNRDTCLLAAGNHFLRCRNSRIYNRTVINTRKHVGWTGWKKICKKRKRKKNQRRRIERESNSTERRSRRIEEKISMSDHFALQEIHVQIKLDGKFTHERKKI